MDLMKSMRKTGPTFKGICQPPAHLCNLSGQKAFIQSGPFELDMELIIQS